MADTEDGRDEEEWQEQVRRIEADNRQHIRNQQQYGEKVWRQDRAKQGKPPHPD